MPVWTGFLPAERLSHNEILEQAIGIASSPVLTAMLDASPGMVALLNTQRQIVFCNEACAVAGRLTSKSEAVGMRPGELLHCVHSTDLPGGCGTSESCRECGLAQAVVAGQRGRANWGECLLECGDRNGEIATEYAVKVLPLPDLGGGWLCYSLTDVSNEKRRHALERVFFHDILNLAGAVEGVAGVLVGEGLSPDERADLLGMVLVSSRALVGEIRSQSALLAAERRELAVSRTECNSMESLQNASACCQAFGLTENKQVVILPATVSVDFRTDAALLGRVLVNLLKNALEASHAGMSVTATCATPAENRIRFSIHNESVMPEHVCAHVFQRSFTTKGSGRGLGTYSVKLLTESYLGGSAWFDSAEGAGTTFHVEFDR
ncbi:MAG TPA: ATP-binding protein [Bryobacteraceae bacterium]|nr:ATP-binding protein [Bryobacteraceae bacterium]